MIWEYADGILTIRGTGTIPNCDIAPWCRFRESIQRVIISEGITSIGDYAFSDCSRLTLITIPESVTSIGICAFYNCRDLTSITIPDRVTSIGNGAFIDCISLTSITIPGSVTNIGGAAFLYCSNLTSITISEGVTSIGDWAFAECSSLIRIECHSLTPPIIFGDTFNYVDATNCLLYIPTKSVDTYKAAEYWQDFNNIFAMLLTQF